MSLLKSIIEHAVMASLEKGSGQMPETPTNLTWKEAKTMMSIGSKMTHEYFTKEEFFYMDNGKIYCEQGFLMDDWFTGEDWQKTGWRIYNG